MRKCCGSTVPTSAAPAPAPVRLVRPVPATVAASAAAPRRAGGWARQGVLLLIGDLAVLLGAGLQLDRALTLAIDNLEDPRLVAILTDLLRQVREGVPLSRAMAGRPDLFPPEAIAITEAGEANGRLGEALTRAATMLGEAAELRRTIGAAMTYPIILMVLAVAVILMMLLFVVPQFESLFATQADKLPATTRYVMTASRMLQDDWAILVGGLVAIGFGLRQLAAAPAAAAARDRLILKTPLLGALVRRMETARFARSAGSLLESGVPLPHAFDLSERTLKNRVIKAGALQVAAGIRQGGGIAGPLAAANIFPRIAIGFIRTGEESSQLGPMLTRLADVLERDIRSRLARIIAIATPAITVILGGSVAFIIAAVMTAILGFNDLAVAG
ncbi:type II secretion system protein [alpha proteobacterium AAP81b]|nr:type II secretion system protein [alpha proteobacterium AAP81b]